MLTPRGGRGIAGAMQVMDVTVWVGAEPWSPEPGPGSKEWLVSMGWTW